MLKIQLIGNAGDVAERRYLKDNSGNFFLELQVAVNTGSKDRKRTDWIKVNINNPKLMAVAEQYITKGTKLYIEGFPGTEGYITKEELLKTAEELKKTDYGQYLFNLVKDD